MAGIYRVSFSSIYQEKQQSFERGLDTLFASDNDKTAIVDGIKWALGREKALPGLYSRIACIKVGRYKIAQVDKNGYCQTGHEPPFYEWKYDTSPNTLKEELEKAVKNSFN